MFEQGAGEEGAESQDAAGFLTAATEALAKLPANLWRTGYDGFAGIAAAMDALAVQLDCARVALVTEAESRGSWTSPRRRRRRRDRDRPQGDDRTPPGSARSSTTSHPANVKKPSPR